MPQSDVGYLSGDGGERRPAAPPRTSSQHSRPCPALDASQVVVSDVGPTIPGVTAANLSRFLLELVRAVAGAALVPACPPASSRRMRREKRTANT